MRLRFSSLSWFVAVFLLPAAVHAQSGPAAGIAFHSNRDGNNNIYVMNADGSAQAALTLDPANDQRAEIAPDGSRVVFASTRSGGHFEIFVMNSDGSDVRQLTFSAAAVTNTWPRWSPDGAWIAFQSNANGAFQIVAIHPDGTELHQITNTGVNQFPAWSPDGTRLAVRRDVDIYLVDASDGSNAVRLTTAAALNQMPSWSPDGTQIAFMSTREPGGYPSVFVMNADGTGQRDLTPKCDGMAAPTCDVATSPWSSRAPAWSPNGAYIYFTGIRPGLPTEQIYVMRADGSEPEALTSAGVNAEATVRHVRPPVVTGVAATPNVLWPPNNQMVNVSVNVGASDDSDPAPTCRIIGVSSNEPAAGTDWSISGALTLDLLARRLGEGTGRVYTLTVACTNTSELTSMTTVTVTVPHDQRK
jgi:Tol biopolymer transport system component